MRRLSWLLWLPVPAFAATLTGWMGTYTVDNKAATGSQGIYAFHWNTANGVLSDVTPAAQTSNPSYLVLHPNGRYLYAVNEDTSPSGTDRISAFAVETGGTLRALGSVSSQGSAPCFLSIDATGKWLFVANYTSGSIAVFRIGSDGRLGEAVQVIQQQGSGPVAPRQQSAHAHQVVLSPDQRFLLSVDLGADKIFIYRFDAHTGRLTPNVPAFASMPAGYGPRHLVFSKDAHRLYVVSELDAAITTLGWQARQGTLTQLAVTAAAAPQASNQGGGAEIALHPNGRWLYASIRGSSNSIVQFRIGADGLPQRVAEVPSGGTGPRYFAIDPSGRYLIDANQNSNDVFVFRIDPMTGTLTREATRVAVPAPVMLLFRGAAR